MRWLKLYSDIRGNVAVIFALALIPMLLAVGAAIDYVRAINAQAVLQNAVDSASLAAGASDKVALADVTTLVNDYLKGNQYDVRLASVDGVTVNQDTANGTISVSAKGKMATTFMKLAGYDTVDVSATAGIVRGGKDTPLELVLALDSTGSMAGAKLATLKTAAKSMISQVLANSTVAKVGIVPFGGHVNVGKSRRSEPWISVPADYTAPYCYDSYPAVCKLVDATCYADGVPYACQQNSCTYDYTATPTPVCSPSSHWWNGCVGSRLAPLNDNNTKVSTDPYPGLLDVSCNSEITDLTNSKTTLNTAVDAMFADYDTFIPGGLLWGWNMLTPEMPLTSAQPLSDIQSKGGKKALVLMTDGANTLYESGNSHYGCYGGAICDQTDQLTSRLCENIKADGITLYTVLFDVFDAKIETMLRDCASDPSMSYVASDPTALLSAFNKIGKSLASLRLAK